MMRDDYIKRQISALAAFVARLIGLGARDRTAESAVAEAQAAGLVGLDLDMASRVPASVLLDLLTTADGLEAERCLALGLGLALRADAVRESDPGASLQLTTSALALLHAAIEARPRLDDDGVQAVITALLGG